MNMKKIGLQMSFLMGLTLSFFLSLTGLLAAGKFSPIGWLISFAISFFISMIIGFIIPMKKVNDAVNNKFNLEPGKFGTRCVESLISDLIYTPIITLAMVFMAYKKATAHGAKIPFMGMFGKSLLLSLAVGFVLIFIFMPIFMKTVLKKNGIGGPGGMPGPRPEQKED
ncbi:MAG: hypothetical protein IJT72_07435 [Lachnospiraceae bacterium]|nr:hypothetical protein [Lachnospiraceae bacterium]